MIFPLASQMIQLMHMVLDSWVIKEYRILKELKGYQSENVLTDDEALKGLAYVIHNGMLKPAGVVRD